MRTHVKVLGVLQILFGGFSLLMALGGGVGLSLIGSFVGNSGEPDAETGAAVLSLVAIAIAAFFGLVGALAVACGIGVVTFKPWARIFAIVVSALGLFSIPFGTLLGIYGLWVLFNKETEALFKNGGVEAPPASQI